VKVVAAVVLLILNESAVDLEEDLVLSLEATQVTKKRERLQMKKRMEAVGNGREGSGHKEEEEEEEKKGEVVSQ
jgi:hypothetical protein